MIEFYPMDILTLCLGCIIGGVIIGYAVRMIAEPY